MSDLFDRAPSEPIEPKPVHKCIVCDEWIYEGEVYFADDDTVICNNEICLSIYAKWTLVERRAEEIRR